MSRTFPLLRRARWLLCVLLLCAGPALALDPAAVVRRLEELRQQGGAPGASAAIMVEGRLVYSGGVGLADAENDVPMTGGSVHNVGSVSKLFGALGVMQLVEQRKAALDAPIQDYAPWFPRKQAPVTVRALMTHTAGIRHYRDGEFGDGEVLKYQPFDSLQAASKRWQDEPLLFAPGSYWHYTSFGASLLQAVIEHGSGQPLEAYLREHVWVPAGMVHAALDVPSRVVRNRAHGYYRGKDGALTNADQENVSYKYIGGGIIASDEDMVRFGHALNQGRLLGRKAIAEMYRPQLPSGLTAWPDADGKIDDVPRQALVWRALVDQAGRGYVGHSGSVKGARSFFASYPAQDVVVSLHINSTGPRAELEDVAEDLAALVLPSPPAAAR